MIANSLGARLFEEADFIANYLVLLSGYCFGEQKGNR
jgi:hypothetical protein